MVDWKLADKCRGLFGQYCLSKHLTTQEQPHCKNTLCICFEMLFNPDFYFKTRNIMHFV